jgi:hypothetical protein
MSQSNRWFALLLVLLLPASVAMAQVDLYLYNENVVGEVNIGAYVESGDVQMLDGKNGQGSMKYIAKGPAPAPYPSVHVWEMGIEQLGSSAFTVNGIRFINHGTHWVKNKKALVLWEIVIPNASSRLASEFAEDVTLSLWVDWNQDKMWSKGEKMIQDHINLANRFPTTDGMLHIYYLTSFRVPDVDGITSTKKPDTEEQPGNDKGIVYLWVRGIVSYDDPDVSPDGEQIFGETEDYRVTYMQTPRNMKE